MNWLIARFREPSTWRGIVWLLTAFGVSLRPEIWEQITVVGMAIAGLIAIFTSDNLQNNISNEPQDKTTLPEIELIGKASTVLPDKTDERIIIGNNSCHDRVIDNGVCVLSNYRPESNAEDDRSIPVIGWGDRD